jgi:hypothetical protein
MPTTLENVFYQDHAVKLNPACLIEYNMNDLIDGISVSNVEVDSGYTSDAAYRAQITHEDYSTFPHGADVSYKSDGPIPFKKLFPLDSVVQPMRPSSCGIKYSIPGIGDNLSVGTGGDIIQAYNAVPYPTDKPRIYYPGISNAYKYWVGAKNKNIALKVTYKHDSTSWTASKKSGSIPVGNKYALANKIVIKFEKYHSKPISAWVSITKSNGEVVPNVALTLTDFGAEWNGEVAIYYNGTTWSKNVPTSYSNTQEIKSVQLDALVSQGITPSADIGVIEISARLVKDISSDLISMSINQSSSADDGSALPVGIVNSNTLEMSLANYSQFSSTLIPQVYERTITSFDSTKLYLVKNALLTPFFKIYHPGGAIDTTSSPYDKNLQGEFYIDTYQISEHGDYTITALDGSKQLMDTFCPDILCKDFPSITVIMRLLDSVGFTKYNFNIKKVDGTDDSITNLNHWWTEDTQTVWEALQELCKDSQTNAFFDKNGVLQIYTRNAIYDTSREINWQFTQSQDGGVLPNIISFAKNEIPSSNSVKVLWQTPISSTYIGGGSALWTSPAYSLSAGGLGEDITAGGITGESEEFLINLDTIDPYSKIESFYSYNGFVLIDSEIIEYDAIGYQYVKKNGDFIDNVWISSASDLNQYRSDSKPGAADLSKYQETAFFKPNGKYRIKKDNYGKLVGRGALGTKAIAHYTLEKSKAKNWTVREVAF